MSRYCLKLTVLSPLHIGIGEDFEPTSYIIDNRTLYEFDPIDFYHGLSIEEKNRFKSLSTQGLHAIKRFYDGHKEQAKAMAFRTVPISEELAKRYNNQYNKDGSLNKNQLQIAKTAALASSHLPYIPGSSLKGVFETALGIYQPKVGNEVRQNLLVSDFFPDDAHTRCGFAMRRHKFQEKEGKGIPAMVEVLSEGSCLYGTVVSDKKGESERLFGLEEIGNALQRYDENADSSMFARYRAKAKGGWVFRMGRFVGVNFTSPNPLKKPVTHSLFTMDKKRYEPFGWIHMLLVQEDEYSKKEREFTQNISQCIEITAARKKRRQEEIEIKHQAMIEAQRRKAQEEAKKRAEAEAEAKRKASLSPVDRLLEEYDDATLVRMMQNGEIENYEAIKMELANKIKARLQQEPKKWEKAKQKALKRKEFIESILG